MGIIAGTDHRTGDPGTTGENIFTPSEAAALHTVDSLVGASEVAEYPIALSWSDLVSERILPEGHELGEAELLFSKIEDEPIDEQIARLDAIRKAQAAKVEPQKDECSFEDFEKMDIRTATVLEAERVPKTDKLLKLTIDTGIDTRTIVSGIAEYYSPEDMLGKQICILANLAPRKIRGIESKGMILMARQGDGKMRFVTPQEVLTNGAQIG